MRTSSTRVLLERHSTYTSCNSTSPNVLKLRSTTSYSCHTPANAQNMKPAE